MKVVQFAVHHSNDWPTLSHAIPGPALGAQLVLAFGERQLLEDQTHTQALSSLFPQAQVIQVSTAGQILADQVPANAISVAALYFHHSTIQVASRSVSDDSQSEALGKELANSLEHSGLRHVMVFADGTLINGSELVDGLNAALGTAISVTGGLAADGERFERTLIGLNSMPSEGQAIAIGFYGDRLRIGFSAGSGWDPLGPERKVTRSERNVIYELDGKPALDLYSRYLAESAEELPGAAVRYPLALKTGDDGDCLVRSLLFIDEEEQGLVLAGNIPNGATTRFMRGHIEHLIDGAVDAAHGSLVRSSGVRPEFSLMISSVGRKAIMGDLLHEEVENAVSALGNPFNVGFYGYGEICPAGKSTAAQLHNQTVALTTLAEV